jgi:ABC-type transporter Mla subunit MlaD
MAADKDYTRLGLFLIVATVVVLVTVLFVVQRVRDRPAVQLVTYTDQNVAGLRTDSLVRFKGVTVGHVRQVSVNADSRLVEISFDLFLDQLTGMVEAEGSGDTPTEFAVPEDMRVNVVGNPISGEAYLLIDTPSPLPPPLVLGFEPDLPYMPSMPSPLANVMDRLPELIERGLALFDAADELVARLPETLDRTDAFLTSGDEFMVNADEALEESDLVAFAAELRETIAEIDEVLGRDGTLAEFLTDTSTAIEDAELPSTTEALRELTDGGRASLERADLAIDDLRYSLPAILGAIEQLRTLARFLEEQPESVLYGRRPKGEQQ